MLAGGVGKTPPPCAADLLGGTRCLTTIRGPSPRPRWPARSGTEVRIDPGGGGACRARPRHHRRRPGRRRALLERICARPAPGSRCCRFLPPARGGAPQVRGARHGADRPTLLLSTPAPPPRLMRKVPGQGVSRRRSTCCAIEHPGGDRPQPQATLVAGRAPAADLRRAGIGPGPGAEPPGRRRGRDPVLAHCRGELPTSPASVGCQGWRWSPGCSRSRWGRALRPVLGHSARPGVPEPALEPPALIHSRGRAETPAPPMAVRTGSASGWRRC
jgi:hypothetical protein